MKDRVSRLRLLRQIYRQFAVYFYLFLSLVMILLGFSSHPLIEGIRSDISDVTGGVIQVFYAPVRYVQKLGQSVSDTWDIREKNKMLRAENQKMLQWVALAKKLENENERLKKELKFISVIKGEVITASIVADNGGAFSRSVLARAGRENGIEPGTIALFQNAVLGRVVSSGKNSSRILLLTDFSSRVPVIVGDDKYLGIVEGNNSDVLKLTFLPENAKVRVGDYVMTSGHGQVFPFGLAIGTVSRVDETSMDVTPFAQRGQTDFVQLVDYGHQGLLPEVVCDMQEDK